MKESSRRRNITAWIFLCLIVLSDVGFGSALIRQWQSGKYTATAGRILRSEGVISHWKNSDNVDQTSESWDLSFEYEAGGQRHVGNTYRRFNSVPNWMVSPIELAGRFKAGTPHPVYFDPANPAFAVLEAGWKTSDSIFAGGLLLLNAFVAMVAIPGAGWTVLDMLLALVPSKGTQASAAPGIQFSSSNPAEPPPLPEKRSK